MDSLNNDKIIEPCAGRKPNGDIMVVPAEPNGGTLDELRSITIKKRGWRRKTAEILTLLGLPSQENIRIGSDSCGECTVAQYKEAYRRSMKLRRLRGKTNRGGV